MTPISDIRAETILDSRGRKTLSVTVSAGGTIGTFAVPSGASTGSHEALELRDQDGGMRAAIASIDHEVRPALLGMDARDQRALDARMIELDGTENKSRLGGNALIGVSIAACKCAAAAQGLQSWQHLRTLAQIAPSQRVPFLYMNYINGGKHADSPLSFQEHLIVPQTDSVEQALGIAGDVGAQLARLIEERYGAEALAKTGDEGGYVIPEHDPIVPFELLEEAANAAGHAERVRFATDVAASSFYQSGAYAVGGKPYTATELADLYRSLVQRFPLLSIEDPFEESDLADFAMLQKSIDARIVGDDLTVTAAARIAQAAEKGAIRAVIVKPNQVGTLSETLDAMQAARARGVDCIVSHRSGETMDDFVADLAYATSAFGLKAGAPRAKERVVKYERLKQISSV